jgi:hypothetical protein
MTDASQGPQSSGTPASMAPDGGQANVSGDPPQEPPSPTYYGLIAVVAGIVGVVVVMIVATVGALMIKDRDTFAAAAAFAGSAITAISTIAAAYFGIKVGQENTKDATQSARLAADREKKATAKAAAATAVAISAGRGQLSEDDVHAAMDTALADMQ